MRKEFTDNAVQNLFNHGLLLSQRTIFLEGTRDCDEYGAIDGFMASKFIKAMTVLESVSSEPITIIISSYGGDARDAFSIYDRIKSSKCVIIMIAYGKIMSAGVLIFQAADNREIAPNTTLMIHDGEDEYPAHSYKSAEAWIKNSKDIAKKLYGIYYNGMKRKDDDITIKKIERLCQNDYVLSAQKSVECGLADRIYEGEDDA